MSAPRHLSWGNFCATVFIPGQQRVHRVADSPRIEVFGDGNAHRIGLWIEMPGKTLIPPEWSRLASISTRTFKDDKREILEVATSSQALARQFYHFATAVAERIAVEKCSAVDAVDQELRCFSDLLQEKALLGIEQQLGLLGELIVLERLIAKQGVGALDSWLGPMGEPHDFRIGIREFEVKTTLSPRRVHTIHGIEQLAPADGCSLYIISVLLGPPGKSQGFSLADMASKLAALFSVVPLRLIQFNELLEKCGFRAADSGYYTRRFAPRRPLGLVRVDSSCPAITRPTVQRALGVLAARIEGLQYEVNVDGLEHEDGTVEFEQAVAILNDED